MPFYLSLSFIVEKVYKGTLVAYFPAVLHALQPSGSYENKDI